MVNYLPASLAAWIKTAAVAALFALAATTGQADKSAPVSALKKPVPESTTDLRAIEDIVRDIAEKTAACSVGLSVGMAVASGVVVSEDGYVLTAAHVIGRPGRDVQITFPDGTIAAGKTLGLNVDVDGGLVKITDKGPWPYAPIVSPEEGPQPGDWCLATGHPGGFQDGRTAPVRLGRVIRVDEFTLRTDCVITEGDSGGPLFDMRGRVIGIHSRISEGTTVNLHVPALACLETWDRMQAGEVYTSAPSSRFLARFDIDQDGKITRAELPAGLLRRVFDRMAGEFGFDPKKSYTMDELKKAIDWNASSDQRFDPNRATYRMEQRSSSRDNSLARSRFVRGRAVLAAFRDSVHQASRCTVQIRCDGEKVALGTIVDSDGWILTKASRLTDKITCQLDKGQPWPARVVRADASYDLALLRVDATDLPAIKWSTSTELRPGSWLATPGVNGSVLSVGVVSVAERAIARTPGMLGVAVEDDEKGALITRVFANSGAARAGIKENDIVTRIMGQPVRDLSELKAAVQKYRVADVVKATIHRGDKQLEISVTLGMPQDMDFFRSQSNQLNGPLSRRRDDFPSAIQHDSVMRPTDCGGPIVDVSGNAVGVNVARADRTFTYAVPSHAVKALLARMKPDAPASSQ